MSNVVNNNVNHQSFSIVENIKPSNNAQEQEVNDLSEILKQEYKKYVQYKIIYDTLEEYVREEDQAEECFKTKIRDIMQVESFMHSISSDSKCHETSIQLFEKEDLNNIMLTYFESNKLQGILNLRLDQKYKSITSELQHITNKDVLNCAVPESNYSSTQLCLKDKILIEYQNKLISKQEEYVQNLLDLMDLLEEITNLKLHKLPHEIELKVKHCQMEEKINSLKSQLFLEKCRVDTFTETSCTLVAYKELIKDIKDQQQDIQKEINHLNELKEKYNQVSCKQYDEILQSYSQYKDSIEKKKNMYECLKS